MGVTNFQKTVCFLWRILYIVRLCVFAGEGQCHTEQSGSVDLFDAHGQVSDGQHGVVLGEICQSYFTHSLVFYQFSTTFVSLLSCFAVHH